jgi:hypothetical protein
MKARADGHDEKKLDQKRLIGCLRVIPVVYILLLESGNVHDAEDRFKGAQVQLDQAISSVLVWYQIEERS